MIDANHERAFFEKYNLDVEEYENVAITTLPFSIRVINRLMSNGITTVAKLLKHSPSSLMRIRSFGKNCLDEVEAFCGRLCEDIIEPLEKRNSTAVSLLFIKHRNKIATGNFLVFEDEVLCEAERKQLERYKEAYDVLKQELVSDCVNSPEKIFPIVNMYIDYQESIKNSIEILTMARALPNNRKNNKAFGYINAFTLDENERAVLQEICGSENVSLLSMAATDRVNDAGIYQLLKRFYKWCAFDLRKEIDDLFLNLYSKDKIRTVVQSRAKGMTLEQIGGTFGVSRERIRQIESKAKKHFARLQSRIRIVSKISAERNSDAILTPSEIQEFCGEYYVDLLFLLQSYESVNYTYDRQLDVFVLGDDSIVGRAQSAIELLPEIVKDSQLNCVLGEVAEEENIPIAMLEKAFLDAYRRTGEIYHRCRLSLAAIYERVLEKHYHQGVKLYDVDELQRFRKFVEEEYGEVGLPESDRALTSRIASICILCGKGVYRLKNKDYISKQLANKICNYIEKSENTIFMTNTLFSVFKEELIACGIDNKYFLQGVLHDLYGDKFVFRRDYISKDASVTSLYAEIVNFIKKSDFPVSKAEIQKAFPGVTDIVILLSAEDPNVLNYFGTYFHASKLNISDSEKSYLFEIITKVISDGDIHHSKELYEIVSKEKPEIFTRNAAMLPFSAFSIFEFLFREKVQFYRPYLAKNGIEIDRAGERLHDLIYSSDEFAVDDISAFCKENHFNLCSILDYINGCNDEYLLVNEKTMLRIKNIGINKDVAKQVESIILDSISETTPIKNLSIWAQLPSVNVPWTEWLIYSVIFKWGTKLLAATSSNQFRSAVPLVAPVDNYDASAFKDMTKGNGSSAFVVDDLSNLDLLLEDIIDEEFLDDF